MPKQVMDSRGFLTTRHVREDTGSASSDALSGATAVDGTGSSVPTVTNWDYLTEPTAKYVATNALKDINNPEKLWQNFDFFTGMLESAHGEMATEIIRDEHVTKKLRDTWLAMHGTDITSPDVYKHIEGDDGYEAYTEASDAMREAMAEVIAGPGGRANPRNGVRTVRPEPLPPVGPQTVTSSIVYPKNGNMIESTEDASAPVRYDEPASREPLIDRIMDAKDDFAERFGDKADNINDVLMGSVDEIVERHTGEIPAEVGGTVTAWSDLNPFKGWGRKKRETEQASDAPSKVEEARQANTRRESQSDADRTITRGRNDKPRMSDGWI